jgi:hypothetical protein
VSGTGGTAGTLRAAIEAGQVAKRLWLYSNYHSNLSCTSCLTSPPGVPTAGGSTRMR